VQAGGKSRLSAIVHGLLIFLVVALIPNILMMIPNAALAAILLVIGFKLASPSLFKKQYKKGWSQFVPFLVTIIAILATDLLKGVTIGLVVGIGIILWRNFLAPYRSQVEKDKDGKVVITLKLAEIVSFLNKGAITQTLQKLPPNSSVFIDGRDSKAIDPDVVEVIEDFIASHDREQKGIELRFEYPDYSQSKTNELSELKNSIEKMAAKGQ
jgi:MFS superfamily sulfate permease-like transporter